jgi:hypothetical protein
MSKKPMRTSSVIGLAALAAVITATASCGDVVRSNDSSVMLVVNSLTVGGSATHVSDVVSNTGSTVNDSASAQLAVSMKDFTAPSSTNNQVTISRYRVEYRRADGRNTPGVDVPFPFDGAVTLTIAAGSAGTFGFEIVRHVAKEETPLVQLRFNPNVISTITDVTFFGTDLVGNDVSAKGSMQINFTNLGT